MIRKSILIVEDCFVHRSIVSECLVDEGYRVTCAGEGEEALAVLKENQGHDLIVLDLTMPGMDGFAFRRAQARDPSLSHIPVILYSSEPTLPMIARELDVAQYASKLDGLDVLLARVRHVIGLGDKGLFLGGSRSTVFLESVHSARGARYGAIP